MAMKCRVILCFLSLLVGCNLSTKLYASVCGEDWIKCQYELALDLMEAKKYEEAVVVLRELLIYEPDYAGAWLDLATAYFALSQNGKMLETLEFIERKFFLPPGIKHVIDSYRNETKRHQYLLPSAFQLEIELGYGNNLNNATDHHIVNIAGSDVTLGNTSRPKGGGFVNTVFQGVWQTRFSGWAVQPWLAFSKAEYENVTENGNSIVMTGISAQRKEAEYLEFISSFYYLDQNNKMGSEQQRAWWQLKLKKHNKKGGWQGYWVEVQKDKNEQGSDPIKWSGGVDVGFSTDLNRVFFSLELDRNDLKSGGHGGDQNGLTGKVGFYRALVYGEAKIQLKYRIERDGEPYQKVLFDEERRNLRQMRIESSWRWDVNGHQSIALWLEYIKESSKIKLFDSTGLRGGVRWQYRW